MTEQRTAVDTRHQAALAPVLTNQPWDADPCGVGPAVRHSSTPTVIWVHRDGGEVFSDDPSFDPWTPGDADGRRAREVGR